MVSWWDPPDQLHFIWESCQSEYDSLSSYHLFPTYKISKQRRQDSIQYQYVVTWCKLTCHAWRSYSSIALCFLRHLPSNMIQLHKFGTIHVQGAHSRGNRSHIILFWVMADVEHLEAKRSVTWHHGREKVDKALFLASVGDDDSVHWAEPDDIAIRGSEHLWTMIISHIPNCLVASESYYGFRLMIWFSVSVP